MQRQRRNDQGEIQAALPGGPNMPGLGFASLLDASNPSRNNGQPQQAGLDSVPLALQAVQLDGSQLEPREYTGVGMRQGSTAQRSLPDQGWQGHYPLEVEGQPGELAGADCFRAWHGSQQPRGGMSGAHNAEVGFSRLASQLPQPGRTQVCPSLATDAAVMPPSVARPHLAPLPPTRPLSQQRAQLPTNAHKEAAQPAKEVGVDGSAQRGGTAPIHPPSDSTQQPNSQPGPGVSKEQPGPSARGGVMPQPGSGDGVPSGQGWLLPVDLMQLPQEFVEATEDVEESSRSIPVRVVSNQLPPGFRLPPQVPNNSQAPQSALNLGSLRERQDVGTLAADALRRQQGALLPGSGERQVSTLWQHSSSAGNFAAMTPTAQGRGRAVEHIRGGIGPPGSGGETAAWQLPQQLQRGKVVSADPGGVHMQGNGQEASAAEAAAEAAPSFPALALSSATQSAGEREFKKNFTLKLLKTMGERRSGGSLASRDSLAGIVKAEHRRRAKLRLATVAMMHDLAIQLYIMEDKEWAIGQLRNVQGGALEGLVPQPAWNMVSNTLSSRLVCQVFMEGKERVTFQQLAVRNNLLVSLDQIASMTRHDMDVLYSQYMAAVEATLPKVFDSDVEAAAFAQDALARLLKESSLIRVAHVIGQQQNMNVFAKQEPASIPHSQLRRIVAAGSFTGEQLTEMWGLWRECIATMAKLKAQEQQIHVRLQNALQKALSPNTNRTKYLALVETAAEMSRNLEAQASTMFRLNCRCAISVLHPLQCARMHLAAAPMPLRIHLLFLSSLMPLPPGQTPRPPPAAEATHSH